VTNNNLRATTTSGARARCKRWLGGGNAKYLRYYVFVAAREQGYRSSSRVSFLSFGGT